MIPYAFSSVLKQLENETLVEQARAMKKKLYFEAKRKREEEERLAAEIAYNETLAASAENSLWWPNEAYRGETPRSLTYYDFSKD